MTPIKFLILAIVVSCCFVVTSRAQSSDANMPTGRLFYTELGGPGVIFSANFDSRFVKGQSLGFGYRIGVGFGTYDYEYYDQDSYYDYQTKSYITFPIGINYVFGKPNSARGFEVGGGVTFLSKKVRAFCYDSDPGDGGNVLGFMTFMYRIQRVGGGISFRVGFTPIIGTSGDIMPSAAISIGYGF